MQWPLHGHPGRHQKRAPCPEAQHTNNVANGLRRPVFTSRDNTAMPQASAPQPRSRQGERCRDARWAPLARVMRVIMHNVYPMHATLPCLYTRNT